MHSQIITLFKNMKLHGMAEAYELQLKNSSYTEMSFEDRIGVLLEAEKNRRYNNKVKRLMSAAKLRFPDACIENIIYSDDRGFTKADINELATLQWLTYRKSNLFFTGAVGGGKSYAACAFGVQAIRQGLKVRFFYLGEFLEETFIARKTSTYPDFRKTLSSVDVLIIDDWGTPNPLPKHAYQDLHEIFEDRYGVGSTIITSSLPSSEWHNYINDPHYADSIMDRIMHGAHELVFKGESMRRLLADKGGGES